MAFDDFDTPDEQDYQLAVERLNADLRKASETLSEEEAAYLVRGYYAIQQTRIIAANQERAIVQGDAKRLKEWLESKGWLKPEGEEPEPGLAGGTYAIIDEWAALSKKDTAAAQRFEDAIREHLKEHKDMPPRTPHVIITWLKNQNHTLENQIRAALDRYTVHHRLGDWPRSVVGIGPVLAAGLLCHSHFDFLKTPGNLWAFAGLDPSKKWDKGKKRPWNADLKVLCFKIGESFVKVQGSPNDYYGHVFAARRLLEGERNESGKFADQAAAKLKTGNFREGTEARKAYTAGKLPAAQLHARARRYAVKLFLAHFWEVSCGILGKDEVKPYSIEVMRHTHYVPPPVFGGDMSKHPLPFGLQRVTRPTKPK